MSGTSIHIANNNTVSGTWWNQVPLETTAGTGSPCYIIITLPNTNVVYPDIDWSPRHAPDAELKARRLVESLLTSEQLATWDRGKWVDIPSAKHPGRVYRLMPTEHDPDEPKIDVYERGEHVAYVCLHVGDYHYRLLRDDRLVAKFLLCRFAEEEIETVGNWRFEEGHRIDPRGEAIDVPIPGAA